MDVGTTEVYVGDELYVIAMVNARPITRDIMKKNNDAVEKTVTRYLQAEGFINNEYVYVGMQTLKLDDLPKDWNK